MKIIKGRSAQYYGDDSPFDLRESQFGICPMCGREKRKRAKTCKPCDNELRKLAADARASKRLEDEV